jgi:SAM-dependent methyltransferase
LVTSLTMTHHSPEGPEPALSFGGVADAYDRARPSYPREAAGWLTGSGRLRVLELGAGTGKLTEQLVALGHQVVATDPSVEMLHHLTIRVPRAGVVRATAEEIPVATRSVDVVVAGQAFHWFDVERALPEIARVLRPGGRIGLAWNHRDERIPWVRRLGALIGTQEQQDDPTSALVGSRYFGFVDTATFRFWQPLNTRSLRDLVASRSNVATMTQAQRDRVLRKVEEFYAEYGRGHDGMLLPYVTHCYRAVLRPQAEVEPPPPGRSDGTDTDPLLIDFS